MKCFTVNEHGKSVRNSEVKFTIPKDASTEFGILINKIVEQLQQNEAENLDFIKGICSHLTIEENDETSDVLLFSDDQMDAICTCATVRTLFRTKLRHCWRWDDFSLLKAIVQAVGSLACESLLEQYEQKLDSKIKLQEIFDFCIQEDCSLPEGYEEMVAIISNKLFYHITKEEYDKIKLFTSEHCRVKPYVLLPFKRLSSSSLLIVWSIPLTTVSYMTYMATTNVNSFIEKSFVYLKISSSVIIDQRSCDVSPTYLQ